MLKPEERDSVAFAKWLALNGYMSSHVGNESGQRGTGNIIAMMAKKKRMGTRKGFPDYVIVLKRNALLFLELKRKLTPEDYRKDGELLASAPAPSDEQVEWLRVLNLIPGITAWVAYGFEAAVMAVLESEKITNK